MAARAWEINPDAQVRAIPRFFTAETAETFDFSGYDFVADCIDSVPDKILLLACARAAGAGAVSCMGAGNKFDANAFRVAPIEKTRVCPLAAAGAQGTARRERDGRVGGVLGGGAAPPRTGGECRRRALYRSLSYVPASAGLLLAGHIIQAIAKG